MFTATTQIQMNGTAVPTVYVSPTEITFVVAPFVATVGIYTITVIDGATVGAGSAPLTCVDLATDVYAGMIIEPPADDKGYVRRRDLLGVSAWVPPADTPVPLSLVEIHPDTLFVPSTAPVTIRVFGSAFTATTQLLTDGTPVATTLVSPTEMTYTFDPTTQLTDRTILLTVQEPGPPIVVGGGADIFTFTTSAAVVDYGIGLALDETQIPPIVNLTPAGDSLAILGGIYVVDRTRTAIQGLELNGDGSLHPTRLISAPPWLKSRVGCGFRIAWIVMYRKTRRTVLV
jgi:hypothetical protein